MVEWRGMRPLLLRIAFALTLLLVAQELLARAVFPLPEVLNFVRIGATIATYSSTQDPEPKLPFYRMMYMDLRIRLVIVYAMPEEAKRQAIADIEEASRAGWLQHRVAHVVDLDEIVEAHELIENGGFRGCVVVRS